MKTKVVQHVPRINISMSQTQTQTKTQTQLVPSLCHVDIFYLGTSGRDDVGVVKKH